MENDGRTLLDPIVIGPQEIMEMLEELNDSKIFDEWLERERRDECQGILNSTKNI